MTSPESIRSLLSAQSTCAGPSALTSIHERSRVTKVLLRSRAQCERGQTSSQNTHFLCMFGALVGFQTGSLTQLVGQPLNENSCSPFHWPATALSLLYSMVLGNVLHLAKKEFVHTMDVYPVLVRGTSCRKGKSGSVHLSFSPERSVTEPQH